MVIICIITINNMGDIYLPSLGIAMVSVIIIYDQYIRSALGCV